jgi:hypothetical protein
VIVEEGSSYRIERDENGDTLVVTDSWTDKISQLLSEGRADGLDLNYAKGFKNTDLSILRAWPLKRLAVLARTVKDLSPVARLGGTLEVLSVQTAPKASIDLAQFPALTALAAEWSQIRSSIAEAPRLADLMVRAYDEADLTPLRWNAALARLRFKDRPRIQHLNGVEALRSLEHLAVYLAPLQDLDALGNEDLAVRELHVESCPIRDLSPLARQRSLTFLNASDCGDLASLSPLRELGDLSILWLFGTTKVIDDDLSPLCELSRLRELRMRSRRTYRPSVEAIQALYAGREQ